MPHADVTQRVQDAVYTNLSLDATDINVEILSAIVFHVTAFNPFLFYRLPAISLRSVIRLKQNDAAFEWYL